MHHFVLIFVLSLSERFLEEFSNPRVDVLVFSFVFGVIEIPSSSSPAVDPDGKL